MCLFYLHFLFDFKTRYELMFIMILKNEVSYIGSSQNNWPIKCPLYLHRVSAGFPSPAEDECESSLNLNSLMVKNAEATFFLRVLGCSMERVGIFEGDIVVVDRSIPVQYGNIVIAFIQNAFTIRRLVKKGEKVLLQAENIHDPIIEIKNPEEFEIWGTVTYVIHKP